MIVISRLLMPVRASCQRGARVAGPVLARQREGCGHEQGAGDDLVKPSGRSLPGPVESGLFGRVRCGFGLVDESVGPGILCTIEDDGPGLSPDHLEAVFSPFQRLETSRNRATGGAGLGLAISRTIVEAHGGAVFVRSRPGEGSKFGFTLPAQS